MEAGVWDMEYPYEHAPPTTHWPRHVIPVGPYLYSILMYASACESPPFSQKSHCTRRDHR